MQISVLQLHFTYLEILWGNAIEVCANYVSKLNLLRITILIFYFFLDMVGVEMSRHRLLQTIPTMRNC